MRVGLTSILAIHWAIVFALLAAGLVFEIDGGVGAMLAMLGIRPVASGAGEPAVIAAVLLAGAFVFAALIFVWACALALVPSKREADDADMLRLAYCAGAGCMTLVMVTSLVRPLDNVYPAVAIQLAALAVSYLVSAAERMQEAFAGNPDEDDAEAAARLMALSAAHGAMLARLSGRTISDRSEAH